jgi:hypothetical protein
LGTYFADVNGDGKADAIAVTASAIVVRESNGYQFIPPSHSVWTLPQVSYPLSNCATYFADVNKDGRADAVFVCSTGVWVSPNDSAFFTPPVAWTPNPYYGNIGTYFADVTGDGRPGAIAVNTSGVTVRPNINASFLASPPWTGPYYGNLYPICIQ